MDDFVVETRADGVVVASGELDIATVEELSAAARAALETTASTLVLDFGGVTFVDSTGLGALVRLRKEAEHRGLGLRLEGVRPEVRRVLDLTGLSEIFPDQAEL